MKLLHVIAATDPESGGPIEALLRISEVLLRDGHEVAVVSLEEEEEVATRKFPFPISGSWPRHRPVSLQSAACPWLPRNARKFDVVSPPRLVELLLVGSWRGIKKAVNAVLHLRSRHDGPMVP